MRNKEARLKRLEAARPKPPQDKPCDTDQSWLRQFREAFAANAFAAEPEAEQAIEEFAKAIDSKIDTTPSILWVLEMCGRRNNNVPAVTIAEWNGLIAWFGKRHNLLRKLAKDGKICLTGDRTFNLYDLEYAAKFMSARSSGSGEAARDMRDLRAKVEAAIAKQRT